MRAVTIFMGLLLFFSFVHALDLNEIVIALPPDGNTIFGDFNVVWEVNSSGDWNWFNVRFVFGQKEYYDNGSLATYPVGTDYNVNVSIGDLNYCADVNGITTCTLDFNESTVLRNGDLNIVVVGYDSSSVEINTTSVSVILKFFNEYNAALSDYDPSGELNVTLAFDCNISDANSGAVVFRSAEANVIPVLHVSGNTITATVGVADLNYIVRGVYTELNTALITADCNFAPDTRVAVVGLPHKYLYIPAGSYTAVTFPYRLDENYQPLQTALNELNAILRYDATSGWVLVSSILSEAYTLYGYYFLATTPVYLPLRWWPPDLPERCVEGRYYIRLNSGWNFINVFCFTGSSCADSNSSLATISFFEVNTSSTPATVTYRPLYQYFATSGSEGSPAQFVTGFGRTVTTGAPVWIWVNPMWASLVDGNVYYYGACVEVPPI